MNDAHGYSTSLPVLQTLFMLSVSIHSNLPGLFSMRQKKRLTVIGIGAVSDDAVVVTRSCFRSLDV